MLLRALLRPLGALLRPFELKGLIKALKGLMY